MQPHRAVEPAVVRSLVIGLVAFLTVIDLFAAQAILPSLARAYDLAPGTMGLAVNASTFGMAAGGLAVAFFSRSINRRLGVFASLAILSIPTALLSIAPDLTTFTILRVIQGVFMSAAFALTLAYLGERCSSEDGAAASAAYITGNVASNLFGRLMAAAVADHLGLPASFLMLAALNLAGAVLVYFWLSHTPPMADTGAKAQLSPLSAMATHFRNPTLRAAFGIGFCILFAFIGTFTYVNFVLVGEPIAIGMMGLGFVYFVFLPSIITTPLAGKVAGRFGVQATIRASLLLALAGLPLVLAANLVAVLAGLVLIGIGTFFAQAAATGFVSRAAASDRGSASGIYLASYFLGGLIGSAVLGQVFDRLGWTACAVGIGASLVVALFLAGLLSTSSAVRHSTTAIVAR
jgi:MFS transporter, YNFM family, putative membrane transport protein